MVYNIAVSVLITNTPFCGISVFCCEEKNSITAIAPSNKAALIIRIHKFRVLLITLPTMSFPPLRLSKITDFASLSFEKSGENIPVINKLF